VTTRSLRKQICNCVLQAASPSVLQKSRCTTHVLTCEGSLSFQNSNSYKLCRKNLRLHYQTPTLLHHVSKWAYHFPEPRQVTIRCPQENGWTSHIVSLGGSGLIHSASTCHIASQEIRTLPVLSKSMELPLDAPHLYFPTKFPQLRVTK